MAKKNKNYTTLTTNLIVEKNSKSFVSEQFKTIRSNIHFSMIDRKFKTIAVTSAKQGAGKSFVSINLSVTLATENKKILLVDADFRRPSVHKSFNLRNQSGLTSLLENEGVSSDDLIHYIYDYDLYVLPSGAIPPNPSELLNSKRMESIMKELESKFDLIIYDLPPVLAVTDAQIIGSKVDGTIFVLPSGQVDEDEALKSKELLNISGAHIIGAVLNRVNVSGQNYYQE